MIEHISKKKEVLYRILVFDDHQEILNLLKVVFDSRGYEVLTYPHPGACPIFDNESCSCPEGQSCTDIILTDINMPVMRGIDFIEKQIKKGCQCRNLALMSGDYTSDEMQRANELGLKFFLKPFEIADIFDWLDQIEQKISPRRKLTGYEELHS
jgi:CheY-like chemotaxis protein